MRTLIRLILLALVTLSLPLSALAGPRGTLIIANHRADSVIVVVDGAQLGPVSGHTDRPFRLGAGPRDLTVVDGRGAVVTHSRFLLDPGAVQTVTLAPPTGQISVRNVAGTTVRLSLDGASLGDLASGGTRVVTASAGTHGLVATYRQLGADRVLLQQSVAVPAGGRASLDLIPVMSGLVRVENQTGRDAVVEVDGLTLGKVRADSALEVQTRLGRVSLALVSGDLVLAQTSLAVGRYESDVWRAAAPRTGDLIVHNPLAMTVVAHDASGRAFTVSARGDVTLRDLPVGNFTLTVTRTSGEPLSVAVLAIRPYDTALFTVPMPSTGLVSVRDDAGMPVVVVLDGRAVRTADPYSEVRLETTLGTHRLQLRDLHGRVVMDTRVQVDPFSTASVRFGTSEGHGHHEGRGDDRDQASYHERPADCD